MREQQDGLGLAVASVQNRDQRAVLRPLGRREDLEVVGVDAGGEKARAHGLCGPGAAAHRARGVDLDELW